MYSNGKFVNNCKSVGPTMIRQHSLSPSRWPTPHLSFSFLFFFPFILHFQISSHLSSPYLIFLSQRKSQTQTSNPVFFIKENPTSPIRKTKIHTSSSLSLDLSLPLFSFFFLLFFFFPFPGFEWQLHWQFFWIWVCTQRPKACLFYIIFWIWMTASISIFLGFFFCFFLF